MSKKLLFKGGHATGMIPYEIEDFSTLYMMDARVDEKTKAYIDGVIGNSVLNLCPYRNVLVTHKYDTVEGNIVTLDDCEDDEIIQLSEIQGNTMVNCNKDTDKELILMPNLETNGYSNVTLTEGIDGGKVDVSLEGNTMVNVCDQEDPIAITKSYTVETGNHIALQGEYDGKCRPNVYGNTMVNLALAKDDYSYKNDIVTNNRINLVHNLKAGVTYTLIRTISEFSGGLIQEAINFYDMSFYTDGKQAQDHNCQYRGNGQYVSKFTPTKDVTHMDIIIGMDNIDKTNGIYPTITISDYMILEGDYTNKPIPDYFTGMKSSFEDKLVPENLINYNEVVCNYNEAKDYQTINTKANQIYTVVVNILENTCDKGVWFSAYEFIGQSAINDYYLGDVREGNIKLASQGQTGIFKLRIGYTQLGSKGTRFALFSEKSTSGSFKATAYVVEGDYTNYDFTDYDSTKAGKYKVDYKVTGKNKFNKDNSIINTVINIDNGSIITETKTEGQWYTSPTIDISNISNITISHKNDAYINSGTGIRYLLMDEDYNPKLYADCVYKNYAQTLDVSKYKYMKISVLTRIFPLNTIQLEEGTTATDYEQYKESIKTLYLNSPLLEGDTIEQSGNNIIHVHRYKEVVLDGSEDESWILHDNQPSDTSLIRFSIEMPSKKAGTFNIICDKMSIGSLDGNFENINTECISGHPVGVAINIWAKKGKLATQDLAGFKIWLQQNPLTVVYELATPTQEIISTNDNLLLDSYANGHLDVDSVIPIDKVVFQGNFNKSLRYLYPNTEYIIQFESNNSGKIDKLHLAGTNSDIFNVVKGVNKYTLTTGELSSKSIVINGIGFNMSKVVVTPKVDGDFGYFKGMKSVGECEGNKIEILSKNKNLFNILKTETKTHSSGVTVEWNKEGQYFILNGRTENDFYMYGENNPKAVNPYWIDCKKTNEKISISVNIDGEYNINNTDDELLYIGFVNGTYGRLYGSSKKYIPAQSGIMTGDITSPWIRIKGGSSFNNCKIKIQFEKNNEPTTYTSHKSNKKEILLNEPLRGLPNGIRDKYVIIDGKWYIERNCGYSNVIIDKKSVGNNGLSYRYSYIHNGNSASISSSIASKTMFVDNMYGAKNVAVADYSSTKDKNTLYFHFANMDNVPSYAQDLTSFREFIDGKVINIVFLLNTPTYEPIDYNPFEVYTDTTHISNNSNIPCNMVIRNSGFNCMLKPNTKYTVSSSNGLSIVTTKDSIGDGILRFYNKDTSSITKMSNVLVLEGDYVTGNPPIPGFFKGMESAFEQELVTDENDEHYGKYKVEVLANNGNLLNGENIKAYGSVTNNNGVFTTAIFEKDYGWFRLKLINSYKLEPGTYYFQFKMRSDSCKGSINEIRFEEIADKKYLSYTEKIINPSCNTDYQVYELKYVATKTLEIKYIFIQGSQTSSSSLQFKEFALSRTRLDSYIPYAINKIQFLLNEPLRGVGNVKDKVYVKEDKIVVERNCGSITFDGSEDWTLNASNAITLECTINLILNIKIGSENTRCDSIKPDYQGDYERIFLGTTQSFISLNKSKASTVDKFKAYLQQNPVKVVYQLATPTYEEVECDLSKLALEGYENGTLFYDTNIPVTTQFYDFDVNIKDMLIPNETYYVTFNADRVKDITINLSGVQVKYKTSMGYNKVPVQLGDVVNTNFSMDSRGVELSDLMVSTSTSLIYVKDMSDVCVYDETSNKYSITITSTNGKESDKRVILLDYPLLRLNKDIYDRLYYSNKDSRYRIDKKVFKHKFTNDHEYSKYTAETNDTYYSSFISLNETIKDYVVITNEKVKTVKVEDDKYYFKIKWSDLGISDKTETNGNQGVKDFFSNNEVYLYYATDGFVEVIDELRRQTLKVYQPETFIKFSGNTTTTVTILIPMKNV